MTVVQFAIPPVVKTVTVRAAPERAFALFADIGNWWPLARVHTGPDPASCAIEPRIGGRIYERAADGRETAWGTVLVYEPPRRLSFSWLVQLSAEQEQLVEISFRPEGDGTRVDLTHSGWEKLGDAAADRRERYDRGWVLVFEQCFAECANAAA